tara:strand:+ start:122 stop:484 length:363 start_codon:yes stop_codon:yes gene_type:complete
MMIYTINGKEYTELGINKRCAELLDLSHQLIKGRFSKAWRVESSSESFPEFKRYNPCNKPEDTDAIIDKCWDELMSDVGFDGDDDPYYDHTFGTRWQYIIEEWKCTKLAAACICLIELNE